MPKINVASRDPNASSFASVLQNYQESLGSFVTTNSNASLNTLVLISTTANGALTIDSTVPSTSATTGALVCAGGIGIGGNSVLSGTITVTNTTNSTSSGTGSITTAGGIGIAQDGYIGGSWHILSTAASTSPTTGALTCAGGMGLAGQLSLGGTLNVTSTTDSTSTTTGAITTAGGMGIVKNVFIGGVVTITSTMASMSSTTGALVVAGGLGVGLNTFIQGTIYARNTAAGTNSNGAIQVVGGIRVGAASYFVGAPTFAGGAILANNTNLSIGTSTTGTNIENLYSGSTPSSPVLRIACSTITVGQPRIWSNFTASGNYIAGEDNYSEWFGLGTSSSLTNTEGLRLGIQSSTYALQTFATGTGVARPLTIQTSGNANQIVLNTDGSVSFANGFDILSTANSTSTTTGSLVTAGGVGIGKDVFIGGLLNVASTVAGDGTNGAIVVAGGITAGAACYVTGSITTTTSLQITPGTHQNLVIAPANGVFTVLNNPSAPPGSPGNVIQQLTTTGNYTVANYMDWVGSGTISSMTSAEGIRIGNTAPDYVVETWATGLGVARPLKLQTSGNANQLVLNTDNSATFAGALSVQSTTASTSRTTGAIICAGGIGAAGNSVLLDHILTTSVIATTDSGNTSYKTISGGLTASTSSGGQIVLSGVSASATKGNVDLIAGITGDGTFGQVTLQSGGSTRMTVNQGGQIVLGNDNVTVDVSAQSSSVAYLNVVPQLCTITNAAHNVTNLFSIALTSFASGGSFDYTGSFPSISTSYGVFNVFVDIPPAISGLTKITSNYYASLGVNGNVLITGLVSASANDSILKIRSSAFTDMTTAASGFNTHWYNAYFGPPNYFASNTGVTVTNAYNTYIDGAVTAGTNATITNSYALGVNGNSIIEDHFLTTNLIGRLDDTSYKVITGGSADGPTHGGRIVLSGAARSGNYSKVEIIAGNDGTNIGSINFDIGTDVSMTIATDTGLSQSVINAPYTNSGTRSTPGVLPANTCIYTGLYLPIYGCARAVGHATDVVFNNTNVGYPVYFGDAMASGGFISTTLPTSSYAIPFSVDGTVTTCWFQVPCPGVYKIEFTVQVYGLDATQTNNVILYPYSTNSSGTMPTTTLVNSQGNENNATKTWIPGNSGGDNDYTISGTFVLPLNAGDKVMIGGYIRMSPSTIKWSMSRAGTILITLISY